MGGAAGLVARGFFGVAVLLFAGWRAARGD